MSTYPRYSAAGKPCYESTEEQGVAKPRLACCCCPSADTLAANCPLTYTVQFSGFTDPSCTGLNGLTVTLTRDASPPPNYYIYVTGGYGGLTLFLVCINGVWYMTQQSGNLGATLGPGVGGSRCPPTGTFVATGCAYDSGFITVTTP